MINRFRFALSALVILTLVFVLPAPSFARGGPDGFADLAEKLLPAVVNISTTQTVTARDMMDMQDFQFPEGSPLEEFFQEFMENQGRLKNQDQEYDDQTPNKQAKPKKHKTTSLGSGFVIDPTGYVVTNYHVVKDADEITVILQDNTNLKASVVGKDKKTDLALLKVVPQKPLVAVSWGNSDKVRVGDWIMAIGNPFGLGGTVTAGIISARARDINSGPYDDYLQTDAPINRGNSGGPMFNMDGDVIGVNTAIYSPSGGSVGIGFAIPSQMAQSVVNQLKTSGRTQRGWIGVHIQLVTPEIAESLGIDKPRGALVASVEDKGPAAEAKLEAGDVIVRFNDKDISEMHRLPRVVAETEVGKTVPITVLRKGKEVTLSIKVGELDTKEDAQEEEQPKPEKPVQREETKIEDLGLVVAPLNDTLRKRYGVEKGVTGVVVTRVASTGPAAEQGIRAGDVIGEVSQQEVGSPKQLKELVHAAKKEDRPLLFLVNRNGEMRFVAIRFEKDDKEDKKK